MISRVARGRHFYGVSVPAWPSVAKVNQLFSNLRRNDGLVVGKLEYVELRQVGTLFCLVLCIAASRLYSGVIVRVCFLERSHIGTFTAVKDVWRFLELTFQAFRR